MNYRHFTLAALAGLVFVSCGGSEDDVPLAAATRAGQGEAARLYQAGVAAQEAGNTKKAASLFEEVAKDFPLAASAPEARFRQAKILDHQGELLEAFQAYQAYLSRYPAGPRYSEAIKRQRTVALAAADGQLKNNFLGIKSRLDSQKVVTMLTQVRENAPRTAEAPLVQYKIGEVWERAKKEEQAIAAFRLLTLEYPDSKYAPEAQYRMGEILMAEAKRGNQDQANIDRARETYQDLLLRYPNSRRAKDARARIASLGSADLQRSYDVAEFYRKKGQTSSAVFYYQEVVRRSGGGSLREKARARLAELGVKAP
ncbi:MAG: tetratricopeptide repeat protein [Verrucomicrobiales bacterium]